MKKIENISVIGVGAIGSAYTSKLYDMDPKCVKVIADRERAGRYVREGIFINDRLYKFNYVHPEEKCDPADLILIAVKYHNLKQTIKDIRNHVGKDTIIMPLLNGISSEEIIGAEYGMDKVLYALCVGIDAVRVQNNIQFSSYGQIQFGEKNNKAYSERVEAVKDIFDRANIEYSIPEDMIRAIWWKFMVNVGVNQASAVLRAPYWVFQEIKEAHQFMESAMKEVVTLSQKIGINLKEDDMAQFVKTLKSLSPTGKTSMLQDVEAGRKTEVEMFSGTVCDLGKKYGVLTPVNEALFQMIRTIEQAG